MGSLDDNFDAEKKAMQVMGRSGAIPAPFGASGTIRAILLIHTSLVVQARMLNANPTKVVLLKNMFDPSGADETSDPRFFDELKEDVMEECGKYDSTKSVAGAKIDRNSAGHVYMAFTDADGAKNCLTSLNGRWFAGKQLAAEYCQEDV